MDDPREVMTPVWASCLQFEPKDELGQGQQQSTFGGSTK